MKRATALVAMMFVASGCMTYVPQRTEYTEMQSRRSFETYDTNMFGHRQGSNLRLYDLRSRRVVVIGNYEEQVVSPGQWLKNGDPEIAEYRDDERDAKIALFGSEYVIE